MTKLRADSLNSICVSGFFLRKIIFYYEYKKEIERFKEKHIFITYIRFSVCTFYDMVLSLLLLFYFLQFLFIFFKFFQISFEKASFRHILTRFFTGAAGRE